MANEIGLSFTTGLTLFAVRFKANGEVFLSDGSASEAWGASGHDADDYDVSVPEKNNSGHYVGSVDASNNIADGTYKVCVFVQAGANPADTDVDIPPIAQGVISYYSDNALSLRSVLVYILAAIATLSALMVATVPSTEEIRQEMDSNSTQLAAILADTDELQTDWTNGGRLDLILDAIKKYTDLIVILESDVNTPDDDANFTLTDGIAEDYAYDGYLIGVQDADDSHWELRIIDVWGDDLGVLVDNDFTFTPDTGDLAYIFGWQYLSNIYDRIQNIGDVTNIIDTTGSGGAAAQGSTYYNSLGQDP